LRRSGHGSKQRLPFGTGVVEFVQLSECAVDVFDRFKDRQLECRLRKKEAQFRRRLVTHEHRSQQTTNLNDQWVAAGLP
jgi:hypothetical protein